MFKRFFSRKLSLLFVCLVLIGFFIGYDYAALDSENDKTEAISNSNGALTNEATVREHEADEDKEEESLTIDGDMTWDNE